MSYNFNIPTIDSSPLSVPIAAGQSVIFIGANGSGKTRLGVYIEGVLPRASVQRIAAQKSLSLNDKIQLISLERAQNALRVGHADSDSHPSRTTLQRWGNRPAIHELSDFDALLQTLFAQHNRVASEHLKARKSAPHISVPTTWLLDLARIWGELLPHRVLDIKESSVTVLPQGSTPGAAYPGSEMSDGERAIFYYLGQCLAAPENGVIILDEPENHIHRAILGPLWDAAERARPDCAFIYLTHDVDFASARTAAAKYYLRSCAPDGSGKWQIDALPEETGLPGPLVAELVGSRKPILFVEGVRGSVDMTIYRNIYPRFTLMPSGACTAVIGCVASYQGSKELHWLKASGLVDGDHRDADDIKYLSSLGVSVLPVAEVENVLLLPDVFLALAAALACPDPPAILAKLSAQVMVEAKANLDLVSSRYTARKLDQLLKRVAAEAKDLPTLLHGYKTNLASIDPTKLFNDFKMTLETRITNDDLPGVLQIYDNKGLIAFAAKILGLASRAALLEKTGRLLRTDAGNGIRVVLAKVLPVIA